MWQIQYTSNQSDFVQGEASQELLLVTVTNLVRTLAAIYLLWHILATASWPAQTNWHLWPVSFLLFITCGLTLWLIKRHFLFAQVILHVGLFATITIAVYLFQQAELTFFYALLPILSALVLGWQAALISEAMVCLLVAWAVQSVFMPSFSLFLSIAIVLSGAFLALLGTVAASVLTTVTQWSLYSIVQAQEKMEEARYHRGQLIHLFKQLDLAYYQLERTNAELVVARETAEAAERFKSEFVTNVSHELRTPLNLIIGFTEIMVSSPESYENVVLPAPYRSDLNAVHHSAQHLLTLVDDVLDLARIEAGKIALAREHVDINLLVIETTNIVHDYVAAKGLTLEVNVEEDLPLLWIDRLRIRQTLLNLLVNAARHTERGWIQVDVCRQQHEAGDEVLVRVTDTGEGIAEQEQPKLFQEFHAAEHPASAWHTGTGLGLPISKKFVELHQGAMGVQSRQGIGSCFWFTLPCLSTQQRKEVLPQAEGYHPLVQLGEAARTVVVVHDSLHIVDLVKRYLDGYQVIGASGGVEGQRLAEENRAMAMIIGGAECAPLASNDFLTIHCPLPSTQLAASRLGVHDLLIKPVSRHELLTAIDKVPQPVERVLIVDDNPEIVRMFRRMLRSRVPFVDCFEAYNGAEALELLHTKAPSLVLLDLIMPVIDGQSVLDQMTADETLSKIPVILVSARGQDHGDLRVPGPIKIDKPGGFELGEVIRTIEMSLSLLGAGWRQGGSSASTLAETPAATEVWAKKQLPPT
jgi:signal transduction histidine kinase/CheY-like chemotaxis protein